MRYKISILFLLLIVMATSCHKAPVCDCFDSAGPPASDNRTPVLPYFDQIYIADDINVFLNQGSPEQVIIEGGKNLIGNISATVDNNNMLTLKNENNCDWLRSYKKSIINVYITMPHIAYIKSFGVGAIQSLDTITDDLQVRSFSSGDIRLVVHNNLILAYLFNSGNLTLTGYCGTLKSTWFSGEGFMYCDSLSTANASVISATTGDCYVRTSGELDVVINQIGNVYYCGNPAAINKKINSTGQVLQIKN